METNPTELLPLQTSPARSFELQQKHVPPAKTASKVFISQIYGLSLERQVRKSWEISRALFSPFVIKISHFYRVPRKLFTLLYQVFSLYDLDYMFSSLERQARRVYREGSELG